MLKHCTKKLFTIVLLSTMLFTMFSGTLTASAEEATEIKELPDGVVGEWIWGSTIVEDGAEEVIGCCAEAGVTDVYLLVKGTGGKLAYRQTQFTNLTDTDRDVLQETIDAAHARGIRVHAWICNTCCSILFQIIQALHRHSRPFQDLFPLTIGAVTNGQ